MRYEDPPYTGSREDQRALWVGRVLFALPGALVGFALHPRLMWKLWRS